MADIRSRTNLAILAAASFTVFISGSINAQGNDQGDSGQVLELEELLVTSRKREESLSEIPISVTAFSSDLIESIGLQDINDLQAFTPGFVYEEFSGIPGRFDNSPRFRGVAVNSLSPTRQTASVFIDGIFVANGIQGIGFEDIDRIEIIKGPQSAFFGRNTFGGAVNYITKTPDDVFAGRLSVLGASEEEYGIDASVDIPIASAVSLRLVGSFKDKAGQFESITDGGELGAEETTAIGASLYISPSDDFDAKIRAYYYENEDGSPAYDLSGFVDHNCGPFGGTDTTICGNVPVNPPDINTVYPQAVLDRIAGLPALNGSHRLEPGLDRESLRLSGQFNYTFPYSNITLSALLGFNNEEVRLLRDADDSGDLEFFSYSGREFEDKSLELRLAGQSSDGRLQWSVGANLFDQDFTNNGTFITGVSAFAFGDGAPALEEVTTKGVFGSVGYDITGNVSVTLEGRFQEDEVTDDDDILDGVEAANGTFDNFLPRGIIEWQVIDGTLLYLSYSKGNLPGGFNGEVAGLNAAELAELREIQSNADVTFDEEELASLELGLKTVFLDGRATINGAVYSMDRTDQAFRRADTISGDNQIDYFVNAGEAEVMGLELDGRFSVVEGFELSATFAYVDSEYLVFNSGNLNEVFGISDANGQAAERYPEVETSLSALFDGRVNNLMRWFVRADVLYTDERFADEINLTTAESSTIVNLRAGVNSDDYRVEVFVTNATDSDVPTAINRFRDLSTAGRAESRRLSTSIPPNSFSTLGYQAGLRDKRQVGLRVTYNF